MKIAEIFKNNKKWIESKLALDKNYFLELDKGQSPELLYIGCSDSRVPAEDVMGLEPGDVFVHRNIANVVTVTDLNLAAVIQYAVNNLEVKHVVICGHYSCGGVKAAMEHKDLGRINPWLYAIRDVYYLHRDELNAIENEKERYDKLVEFNVIEQCLKLIKTTIVQKAIRKRGLKVHGWVFDIHTGKIIDLKINLEEMLKDTMDIYYID